MTWEAGVFEREVGIEKEAEEELRWKLKADWGREVFEAAETEPV